MRFVRPLLLARSHLRSRAAPADVSANENFSALLFSPLVAPVLRLGNTSRGTGE